MPEETIQKMEVDYSQECDAKIPDYETLARSGKLSEAIEGLLQLEKSTRTGADAISTGRILVSIVKLCYEAKKWDLLNENIILLTKRRGQLKQAVTKMVQEAYAYIDQSPTKEAKLRLIETLRTVTAGKIYVEIERARLTRMLSRIYEDDGNVAEAATVLQDLQVETFGSMEKKEKVDFILEQMRLCLAKKDFIRTQIISKKISTKFFDEADTHDLKLRYYRLMIELDQREGSYLSISKHYRAIYDTSVIQNDPDRKNETLKSIVFYLILASYDNEQSDLIHRVKEEKAIEALPTYQKLLTLFTTNEIMNWIDMKAELESKYLSEVPASEIFDQKSEEGLKRWKDLKVRVVEHNIRIMAKCYTRIRIKRMAQLLDLTEREAEDFLSNLVISKMVDAKFDRLDGIVHFQRIKDPIDLLNEWAHNVNLLMHHVNKATHLIAKEEMIHQLV